MRWRAGGDAGRRASRGWRRIAGPRGERAPIRRSWRRFAGRSPGDAAGAGICRQTGGERRPTGLPPPACRLTGSTSNSCRQAGGEAPNEQTRIHTRAKRPCCAWVRTAPRRRSNCRGEEMADLLEAARSAEHAAQLKLDEEAAEAVATALNGTVGSSSDDSDGGDISGAAPLGGAIGAAPAPAPVSYTHLTLPTICSV